MWVFSAMFCSVKVRERERFCSGWSRTDRGRSVRAGWRLRSCSRRRESMAGRGAKIVGIVQNVNTRATNVVLGEKEFVWWGRPWLTEILGPYRFSVGLSDLFPGNPFQIPHLYDEVLRWIENGPAVLDCYCGVGSISLWVSKKSRQVTGIEENGASIVAAKRAAGVNGVRNVRFINGSVESVLPALPAGEYDLAILDPPRQGLDETVLDALSEQSALSGSSMSPATRDSWAAMCRRFRPPGAWSRFRVSTCFRIPGISRRWRLWTGSDRFPHPDFQHQAFPVNFLEELFFLFRSPSFQGNVCAGTRNNRTLDIFSSHSATKVAHLAGMRSVETVGDTQEGGEAANHLAPLGVYSMKPSCFGFGWLFRW